MPLSAPSRAERKLVTVLMADLVGHTDILARVDPEEWQALLHAYFAEMTQRIERYGGRVEKFIGDAIFAVFGVPQAHEDDAERAVRAALEMQEALGRLNPVFKKRVGVDLGLRIAAATGEVVTPGVGQLVTGELAALVERLQRQAPPNGIILSERTYRLIAPVVDVEPLGALVLKGFAEGHQAFVVRDFHPRSDALRGVEVHAPLVGREHELKVLTTAYDRLLTGQGQVVVIVGEAGLGKSRLVTELRMRLGAGAAFLEARCQEFTQATAYGIVVQHLRRYLDLAEDDSPEVGRGQIRTALHQLFRAPADDIQQALEHLLRCETPHDSERNAVAASPEETRGRVVRALLAFWEAVAAKNPLLMVVEDLHWIDAASVSALKDLLAATERVPLMLLCVFRPERQSPAWEFKVAADRDYPHRYREVRLEPLSTEETEYLAGLLLERADLPVDLKRDVAQHADGNPFYVEEVVRSLQYHQGAAAGISLPDTLQGVLQARLDGLSGDTRRTLQAASVIGRTFPLRLLTAATGMGNELMTHLSALQRTGFLIEQKRIPEPEFTFKHALLQAAAYQTLLRDERRELHRRVAGALEQMPAGAADRPALVRHFLRGEDWGKAFVYAIEAAEADRTLSALEAALEHYDVALEVARDHPDSASDPAMLFRAQKGRGDTLELLGRTHDALHYFEELLARHSARRIRAHVHHRIGRLNSLFGDLRKAQSDFAKALQLLQKDPDPEVEASIYIDLAHALERRREYAGAQVYARRALEMAQTHSLQAQIRDAYSVMMAIHLYGGDLGESIRYAEESLAFTLQAGDQRRTVLARNNLAHVLLFTGNLAQARRQLDDALALATRLGIGHVFALVQITRAELLMEQARWDEAAGALASAEDAVRRHGLGAGWESRVHRERGFVSLGLGAWEEAVARLKDAEALEKRAGISRHLPRIQRALAEAHLGLGNLKRVAIHASRVMAYERIGNPIESPAALRVLAAAARQRGELSRALELLEQSRLLMRGRQGSGEYARILLEFAMTLAAAGRGTEARKIGTQAVEIYAALEAALLVETARDVVDHFGRGEGSP
jgi:class 3 adenylate cyclase/tetratricopeptide (TPR) repeat protein